MLESINPQLKSFFRGKTTVEVGIESLLKLVKYRHSGNTTSQADTFKHICEHQSNIFFYTNKDDLPSLENLLHPYMKPTQFWKCWYIQKVTEINQLVEACKIYLASEIFKTELEGLAFFTHHVTFPFLHWVKKSTQDKLLVILPKLFKDLKDGKMDILSKFLVTMRQVPVHKPSTELGINDAEACPRGHWHPGCVSNLFVSFNNIATIWTISL